MNRAVGEICDEALRRILPSCRNCCVRIVMVFRSGTIGTTVSEVEQSERRFAVPRYLRVQPTQEAIMRKLAIALVAAMTVGAVVPAAAQVDFYAGPGG